MALVGFSPGTVPLRGAPIGFESVNVISEECCAVRRTDHPLTIVVADGPDIGERVEMRLSERDADHLPLFTFHSLGFSLVLPGSYLDREVEAFEDDAGDDQEDDDERVRLTQRTPQNLVGDVEAVQEQYHPPSRNAAINFMLETASNELLEE